MRWPLLFPRRVKVFLGKPLSVTTPASERLRQGYRQFDHDTTLATTRVTGDHPCPAWLLRLLLNQLFRDFAEGSLLLNDMSFSMRLRCNKLPLIINFLGDGTLS
jgi:hypothetical protein